MRDYSNGSRSVLRTAANWLPSSVPRVRQAPGSQVDRRYTYFLRE